MQKAILHPFHSWKVKIIRADDVYLYGENNKKYIDLSASASVVNVGYNNLEIKKQISKQMNKLIFAPQSCITDESQMLANKISSLFPHQLNRILRAATGSEAVEIAIKVAQLYSKKDRLMSFDYAYHGHTIATLSLGNNHVIRKDFKKNISKSKNRNSTVFIKIEK